MVTIRMLEEILRLVQLFAQEFVMFWFNVLEDLVFDDHWLPAPLLIDVADHVVSGCRQSMHRHRISAVEVHTDNRLKLALCRVQFRYRERLLQLWRLTSEISGGSLVLLAHRTAAHGPSALD